MVIGLSSSRVLALLTNIAAFSAAASLLAAPNWGAELRAQNYGIELGGADFGDRRVGTTGAPATVTVFNTGTEEHRIAMVHIEGLERSDFAMVSDGCTSQVLGPASVAGKVDGGRCSLGITFTPTGLGSREARVVVDYDTRDIAAEGPLRGNGTSGPLADLDIVMIESKDPVAYGDSFTYMVFVSNSGPDEARNVSVYDDLPPALKLLSATAPDGTCEASAQTIVRCSFATIPVDSHVLIVLDVVAEAVATVTNRADVSDFEPADPNLENNAATIQTTLKRPVADLRIDMTAAPDPVTVGKPLTYSIAVTNQGPDVAYGVLVHDDLPAGVTFVSANATQGTCVWDAASIVSCELGKLAPGQTATITLSVTPAAAATIVNQADVFHDYDDLNRANNVTRKETVVEAEAADLSITKSAEPRQVVVGQDVVFTVTVTNDGPGTATSVTMADTLPVGLVLKQVLSTQGNCRESAPRTITCDVGTLVRGATALITVVGTATGEGDDAGAGGVTITNGATVRSAGRDPNPADNAAAAMVSVGGADLTITMTDAPDPVMAGANLKYVINVKNNGPAAATGVRVVDGLPGGVAFATATPSQGSCIAPQAATPLVCDLGALAKGASASITIVVVPNGAGRLVANGAIISNTAIVTANEVDPNGADNVATVETLVQGADLSVAIIAAPIPVMVRNELTYTVTIQNQGPSPATAITLNVTLPAGATFNRVMPAKGMACPVNAAAVSCTMPGLARNAKATVLVVASATAPGPLASAATVAGAEADPVPANNTAMTQTVVGAIEPRCLDGTRADKDTDGDALFDCWELEGIDINGDGVVDLTLPAATVDHKDLYIEVDAMPSHVPSPTALLRVAAAFAGAPVSNWDGQNGIRIHFEGANKIDETSVDEAEWPEPAAAFYAAKAARFGTKKQRESANWPNIQAAKAATYRYAVFAWSHSGETSSGLSLSPADFMVTLGGWSGFQAVGGKMQAEAATFMHELGHTLGLQHGGADSINCKPNYLSIMSYSLQFAKIDPTRPLDYSRYLLPTLMENGGLNEPIGIKGPVGRMAIWGIPTITPGGARYLPILDPAQGPIDWNRSGGANATAVVANVNLIDPIKDCRSSKLQVLTSQNDWTSLSFGLDTSPLFQRGSDEPDIDQRWPAELTLDEAVDAAASTDFDGDGFSNAVDNCPAAFNPDQQDSDGDGVGNICERRDLALMIGGAPNPISVGEELTYSMHLENIGTEPFTEVTLTSELPAGLTFVRGEMSQGTCTGTDRITCNLETLNPGASATISIVLRPAHGGEFHLSATAAAFEPDGTPDDNTATLLLTVIGAGQAPVANAGPDQTIETVSSPARVTLDGSASSHPDGQPLAFEWRDAAGHTVGTEAMISALLVPGTHRFDLTVTDPQGHRGTDSVQIAVIEVKKPIEGADLIVTAVTAPARPFKPGATLTVGDTVRNQGNRDAGASTTRYYLSLNPTDAAQALRLAASRNVLVLAAGAESGGTVTFALPARISPGSYALLACADGGRRVKESVETNNCLAAPAPLVIALPDLMMTAISDPSPVVAPGATLTVIDTVRNGGVIGAGGSTSRFYFSVDTTRDAADVAMKGGRAVPALAPAAASSGREEVTVPLDIPLGVYRLLGCADDLRTVNEANEANNCVSSERSIRVARPDLVTTAVNAAVATALPGTKLSLKDTVTNAGPATAPASASRYYLSADTLRDESDLLLKGQRSVAAVVGGAAQRGSAMVAIPVTVPPGAYHVLACADDLLKIAEASETNNCGSSDTTIYVDRPDLATSALSGPPSTAIGGGTFAVIDTTENRGQTPAAASTTRYYLSADLLRDASDLLMTGARSVGILAAGAASTAKKTVGVPIAAPAGSYYLLACADDLQRVGERDEGNNCHASAVSVTINP